MLDDVAETKMIRKLGRLLGRRFHRPNSVRAGQACVWATYISATHCGYLDICFVCQWATQANATQNSGYRVSEAAHRAAIGIPLCGKGSNSLYVLLLQPNWSGLGGSE